MPVRKLIAIAYLISQCPDGTLCTVYQDLTLLVFGDDCSEVRECVGDNDKFVLVHFNFHSEMTFDFILEELICRYRMIEK